MKLPIRNFRFLLEVDGEESAFEQVLMEGGAVKELSTPRNTEKKSGLLAYDPVRCTRLQKSSESLMLWIQRTKEWEIIRKTVHITALDDNGNTAARWKLVDAWPSEYLYSWEDETVLDSLLLSHEGLTREA